MKLNHIGIIVKNIDKSINLYAKLGYSYSSRIIKDYVQNNRIALLQSDSLPDIELIEPMDENSSVYNFKEGYHHMCYESEIGEDIICKFRDMRIGKIFTPPIVAPALDGRKVVFACLQNCTFTELII